MEVVSLDGETPLRWRLTDVTPGSFTRVGEASADECRTWVEEERMLARPRA